MVFWKSHFLWNETRNDAFHPCLSKRNWCTCLVSPNWTHTRAHSSLRRESSLTPTANGSFKTSFELVTKERIQNWVGCTVAVHKDLEIGLQHVHVSGDWKNKNCYVMKHFSPQKIVNYVLLTKRLMIFLAWLNRKKRA